MARKSPLPPSADGSVGTTRASAVYEQLRADITHVILEPGSKLRVEAMCQRYGVGASPLREALKVLLARCPSRWMRSFCASLADEAYRFRQVAADQSYSSRHEHTEHVAIFEAAIAGHADEAVKLLVKHYTRTATLVASQAKEGGHTD